MTNPVKNSEPLDQGGVLALIPLIGPMGNRHAPTARLREIRRQLLLFPFSQAELRLLKTDIELQLKALAE